MNTLYRGLVAFLLLQSVAQAALYERVEDLPTFDFDYVVVGGGTAGNIVANRLSALPNVSVLVLESGPSHIGAVPLQVPLLAPTLAGTPWDWNFTTTPQRALNNRTVPYVRGRILGGSSSINWLLWTVSTKDDWNRYAHLTGSNTWSWKNVHRLLRKIERFVAPTEPNMVRHFHPSAHSTSGAVSVTLPELPVALDDPVMQASKELPTIFPFNRDINSGNTIGLGWTPETVTPGGRRSSSATAYLTADVLARPNLHVLVHATVTKLVKTGVLNGKPVFGAIEFAKDATSPRRTVRVQKEVILSGGAVGTPQVLLLSGISPREHLQSLNIPVELDLPDVGSNIQDHSLVGVSWRVKSNDTFQDILGPTQFENEMGLWEKEEKGRLSQSLIKQVAWGRLEEGHPALRKWGDPSAGKGAAHWELLIMNGFILPEPSPEGAYLTIAGIVASPMSRGTIRLKANDAFTPPLIDPNFLSHPFDVQTMITALKAVRKLVSTSAMKDFIIEPYGDFMDAKTDAELEVYIRAHGATVSHILCGASMSPSDASWGVVDPELRVKGAANLRIADASVLPRAPSAHTQAAAEIVGEMASEFVLQASR